MPRPARLRLVLYSGGQQRRNALIHETLLELALRRSPARRRSQPARAVHLTYLPFTREGAGPFFRRFRRRYRPFGGTDFQCIAADDPRLQAEAGARREAAARLMKSDIVYLAGGNTFYFLHHLRLSGLLPVVKRFADRGGVVAGLSAGALILTPHIGLAGYPPWDRDVNRIGLTPRDCRGLGLTRFEFFPHFRRSPRYRAALLDYSHRTRLPVYACPDGSGIVLEGDRFTAHGEVWRFAGGQVSRVGH